MWFFRNVLVGFSRYMVSLGAPLPHRATPWTWTVDPPRTNFNFSSSFKFFVNINAWDTPGVRHCQWACKLVMFELDVDSPATLSKHLKTYLTTYSQICFARLSSCVIALNTNENVDLFLFFANTMLIYFYFLSTQQEIRALLWIVKDTRRKFYNQSVKRYLIVQYDISPINAFLLDLWQTWRARKRGFNTQFDN